MPEMSKHDAASAAQHIRSVRRSSSSVEAFELIIQKAIDYAVGQAEDFAPLYCDICSAKLQRESCSRVRDCAPCRQRDVAQAKAEALEDASREQWTECDMLRRAKRYRKQAEEMT